MIVDFITNLFLFFASGYGAGITFLFIKRVLSQ